MTAFAEGATAFQSEFSVRTLTGERRRVVMSVSMLGSGATDWSAVVVAFTDITERRQLEQSLKRANETLRRVNQHLEQFAYAAAHDMREPLRTIALYAQFLERHQPPQPGTRSQIALKHMLENAKRMETLVDDLLRFTRAVEPVGARSEPCSSDPHMVLTRNHIGPVTRDSAGSGEDPSSDKFAAGEYAADSPPASPPEPPDECH